MKTFFSFRINIKIVWLIVFTQILFMVTGSVFKIMHWPFFTLLLLSGLALFFLVLLLLVIDMQRTSIANKSFWILSLFIFPPISFIVYLLKRSRLD